MQIRNHFAVHKSLDCVLAILRYQFLVIGLALAGLPHNVALAHSGGTNADGCHNDHSNNDYHCHSARSEGAYERQMEGYAKVRRKSENTITLWAMLIGFVFLVFKFIASASNDKASKAQAPPARSSIDKFLEATSGEGESSKKIGAPKNFGHIAFHLSEADRGVLNHHGAWLESLCDGSIAPSNEAEVNLLRVSLGGKEPSTEIEHIWVRWQKAYAQFEADRARGSQR